MNQGFKGFKRNNGKNGKERKNRKESFFYPKILKKIGYAELKLPIFRKISVISVVLYTNFVKR